MIESFVALLLAVLPVRWWEPFEERFPIRRMAMLSAVVTSAVGLALVAAVYGGLGGRGWGIIAFYVLVSGVMRVASIISDEVRGDPLLTGIDEAVRGRREKQHALRNAQDRQRREGAEVRDRLVHGEAVGRPEVAFVLLASRVKEDWKAGTCLIGADGVPHRIGEPFDIETPAGIRRAYPLSELPLLEPLRRVVPYELPPRPAPRRSGGKLDDEDAAARRTVLDADGSALGLHRQPAERKAEPR
jgi:hypothetical protein